mgnify:CR=1 FL=1
MFSLWEDCILNTEDITFAQPEAAAASNPVVQADSEEVSVKEQETGQQAGGGEKIRGKCPGMCVNLKQCGGTRKMFQKMR